MPWYLAFNPAADGPSSTITGTSGEIIVIIMVLGLIFGTLLIVRNVFLWCWRMFRKMQTAWISHRR